MNLGRGVEGVLLLDLYLAVLRAGICLNVFFLGLLVRCGSSGSERRWYGGLLRHIYIRASNRSNKMKLEELFFSNHSSLWRISLRLCPERIQHPLLKMKL